ncbi:hypothetical protein AJ88_01555 [Mesorhizobium amorphae CCBAU 01583]|nr:hypothetical protein AJ88_01555 [Mesorhizobium amorphae CCBAU 01583]
MTALCRQTGAGKLGFLAAHDIGRIGEALSEAGHDTDIPLLAGNTGGACKDGADRRRHGDIGRLEPALAGAGHAANDDWQRRGCAESRQMAFEDGGKTFLLRGDQPVVATTLGKNLAGFIDQPDPHAGRAPVDGRDRR